MEAEEQESHFYSDADSGTTIGSIAGEALKESLAAIEKKNKED